MAEDIKIPNETQGLLQGQTRTVPNREWYRFWRWIPDFFLQVIDWISDTFAWSAYGQMSYDGAMSNINSTWQVIPFDTVDLTPLGYTFDTVAHTFAATDVTVTRISIMGAFEHDEVDAGRSMLLRVRNTITAEIVPITVIGTGRNVAFTNVSTPFLIGIDDTVVGDPFVIEVSSAVDTYLTVTAHQFRLALNNVGPWLGSQDVDDRVT